MIHGALDQWQALQPADMPWLAAGFAAAAAHRHGDLAAPGRHHLDGNRLFIDAHCYTTMPPAEGVFENHRRYVDIQFVISGTEVILSRPRADLSEVKTPYDDQADAEFLHRHPDGQHTATLLNAGEFLVLFPGEAHLAARSPATGPCEVRKLVVKVAVPPTY